MQLTAPQQALGDRLELAELIARLGRWLDDPSADQPDALLATDIAVSTPGGAASGRDRVVAQARRNHDRHETQHRFSDVVVDLSGDAAAMSANLVVTFVDPAAPLVPVYTSGARYRFAALRAADGWRLTQLGVAPVWQLGARPTVAAAA